MTDSLVKATAWTNNTNVNNLGFSLPELVTGKAIILQGLKIGSKATEIMTDAMAV